MPRCQRCQSLLRPRALRPSRMSWTWRHASTWTSPASGPSTSMPLSSRATTRRSWRWRRTHVRRAVNPGDHRFGHALRQYESASGSAPLLHRMRRRKFSRSPRPVRSRPRLRPCHRRPERTKVRPCPSPQKKSHRRLLLRWPTRRRVLSERRGLRRPVRSLLLRKRFLRRASPPRPFKSTLPLMARQGLPPQRSRRPRRTRA
jgi:hypothetical protein